MSTLYYSRKNIQSARRGLCRFTFILIFAQFFFGIFSLSAQTHVSVPLSHNVYYILEQAETRGLCLPLPAVKPYTRSRIVEAISEILAAEPNGYGGLTGKERQMLRDIRAEFTKEEAGMDYKKGMYRFDIKGKSDTVFSGNIGIGIESLNSVALHTEEDERYIGTDSWGTLYVNSDIGRNFSFNVDFSVGLMKAARKEIGTFDTYASEVIDDVDSATINDRVTVYSQPLAFFPYTYQKGWDGFMFGADGFSASGMEMWPESLSIAPRMMAEMTGTLFGDTLLLRAGRIQREWGAMTQGSSLIFNEQARPFVGMEMNFNPIYWFSFSSITGVLEFDNSDSIKYSGFQNAFSLSQVEVNYRNYLHFGVGSSAVWPKRFEFGYMFPLVDNFFYQNFIGDFDNMAIHLNVKGQYPGIGKIWFSFYMDELEISSMFKAFSLDRNMFAYQLGMQGIIPKLPFASFTASYTKVEPYNYTHTREIVPWYGTRHMEQAYVNNGVGLGHYLPPNSDEIKLRLEVRPALKTTTHLQYQLIRHGADFGPQQVDGSSLRSELDPRSRGSKKSLEKDFLNDGAYQWMHVVKAGAQQRLGSSPVTIFGEAGFVHSYFTEISDEKYAKFNPEPKFESEEDRPEDYKPRTPAAGDYLKSTTFIFTIGFKIFK